MHQPLLFKFTSQIYLKSPHDCLLKLRWNPSSSGESKRPPWSGSYASLSNPISFSLHIFSQLVPYQPCLFTSKGLSTSWPLHLLYFAWNFPHSIPMACSLISALISHINSFPDQEAPPLSLYNVVLLYLFYSTYHHLTLSCFSHPYHYLKLSYILCVYQ